MRIWTKAGASVAIAIALASPALAQDRRSTAEQIAREIRDAAAAIGTVRDAFDDGLNDVRWRGRDREAVRLCALRVERYGRMRVDDVRPYGRRSLRVHGTIESGWDNRRRYNDRYRSGIRSFTCTVRDDGRVKIKTRRSRL